MGRIWSKRKRKVDNASEKKSYEDTKEIISGKFHRSYRFAVDFLIKGKMSWADWGKWDELNTEKKVRSKYLSQYA